MKLRNKKTGEIIDIYKGTITLHYNQGIKTIHFKRIEDLEEWEDYEEPKEYWYYDTTKNGVEKITHLEDKEKDQAIGNYFGTKKEAERAVEKLKAWKRLKDGGFYFTIDAIEDGEYRHNLILRLKCNEEVRYKPIKECEKYRRDIHLIFGGEE